MELTVTTTGVEVTVHPPLDKETVNEPLFVTVID
jgi:hypothetical protein